MKENTFDVPAYKFFVLKIDDGIKIHSVDDYKPFIYARPIDNYVTIPFDDVDGLEVEEIRDLIRTDDIVIFGAISYKLDRGDIPKIYMAYINALYFDKEYLDDKSDMTIDKIVEKFMEERYKTSDDRTKRVYRCFFERYQDGSYEKTKERIKRLEIGK